MLPRLGHGTVCGTHNEDGTVHLGSTRDHVLYVVCVPWAVNVGVVAVVGSILLVASSYGDAALLFLRGVVYLIESDLPIGWVVRDLLGKDPGYSGGEGGLAVVNVTDGSDVEVWLGALELSSGHALLPFCNLGRDTLGTSA